MKAISTIIATILSFQVSVLFSGNKDTRSTIDNNPIGCTGSICILAPDTPNEANFEEEKEMIAYTSGFLFLTPSTPEEADFSSVDLENAIDLTTLAPTTPAEADFNEIIEDQINNDFNFLAPVTPSEADFE